MSRRQALCYRGHLILGALLGLPLAVLVLTGNAGVGPYRWLVELQLKVGNGSARPMTSFGFLAAFLTGACYGLYFKIADAGWLGDPRVVSREVQPPPGFSPIGWFLYAPVGLLGLGGTFACWRPWPHWGVLSGWVMTLVAIAGIVAYLGWLALALAVSATADEPPDDLERWDRVNAWLYSPVMRLVFPFLAVALLLAVAFAAHWVGEVAVGAFGGKGGGVPAPSAMGPLGQRPGNLTRDPPRASDFPGLLAYWPFDEADGAAVGDQSGNGLDGTLVGAARAPGVRGSAAHFTARGQYFDYGASPRLNFAANAPFTVCLWVATRERSGTILSHRHSRDPGADVYLGLAGTGRIHGLVRQDLGEAGVPAVVTAPAVNDGAWHHVALSREGATVALFVDGRPHGQATAANAGGAITTDWRAAGRETYWVKYNLRQFGDPYWVGQLDELAVFSRALTPAEIARLAGQRAP